jgi:hypothetical protein
MYYKYVAYLLLVQYRRGLDCFCLKDLTVYKIKQVKLSHFDDLTYF